MLNRIVFFLFLVFEWLKFIKVYVFILSSWMFKLNFVLWPSFEVLGIVSFVGAGFFIFFVRIEMKLSDWIFIENENESWGIFLFWQIHRSKSSVYFSFHKSETLRYFTLVYFTIIIFIWNIHSRVFFSLLFFFCSFEFFPGTGDRRMFGEWWT